MEASTAAPPKTVMDFLPQLEEALAYTDTHSVVDVARAVLTDQAQLWVQGDGMVVTQIDQRPQVKILQIWLAAGDLRDVLDLTEQAVEWGREQGCGRARILGRKGWVRFAPQYGWYERDDLTILEKDL